MKKTKFPKTHFEISFSNFPKTKFARTRNEADIIVRNSPDSFGKSTIKRSNLANLFKEAKASRGRK